MADAKSLDTLLARRQRGQAAAETLRVVGPVLADQEALLLTQLLGEYEAGRLTPDRALAGIGGIAALRKVTARLEGQARDGEVAGAQFVAGGGRA